MIYFYKGEPVEVPHRIRLSNGNTRTNKTTFTEEELNDAGYFSTVNIKPVCQVDQKVIWGDTDWIVVDLTEEEYKQKLQFKREILNTFILSETNRIIEQIYLADEKDEIIFNPVYTQEEIDKMLKYVDDWRQYIDMENPYELLDEPVLEVNLKF